MTDVLLREKRAAAEGAAALVTSGSVVGLGTGSTAAFAIEELGRRIRSGELTDVTGVPTSNASHRLGLECGVPIVDIESAPTIDITIDGADEIDPLQRVLKGGGGALLREKIVAARTRRWVIIGDSTKVVDRLGSRYAVPVEVVKFGWSGHAEALRAMGAAAALRQGSGESPFVTDEGHYIIDARFPHGLDDPDGLARTLRNRPGVVETGLFLGFQPEVIIGRAAAE
ncbi:MAG TPA: ribose 5-phosphate isomerase A [Gemmatimonadaceae bacterium]|nr:ribose 5-phosphate isomerase A [Gemmatimonadaceae bacterium]